MLSSTPLSSMLADGSKQVQGLEEAVFRNIEGCKQLSQLVRTSLGPNGMNKMIVDQHGKVIVTSDAATIIQELDVVQAAGRLLVTASKQQQQEVGDGTNLVMILAGELLTQAEALLRAGLHVNDIITGYEKASQHVLSVLEKDELTRYTCKSVRNEAEVVPVLRSVIQSKQFGYEDFLAPLIARACVQILPDMEPPFFNLDNVRVLKIPGGGVSDSRVIKGLVLHRDAEGSIKRMKKAKVAVYATGIDILRPDGGGKILIKDAKHLADYTKDDERQLDETIKSIHDSGVNVIVAGLAISDLAMHFIERYGMMAVRVPSKFDLMRVVKTTMASAMVNVKAPRPEEMGDCEEVYVEEIGSQKVIVFQQNEKASCVSTIVVRASTKNVLDDVERAVDDGINSFKLLTRDGRCLNGAGCVEIDLARRVASLGSTVTGLDQYAIKRYGEALEIIPRTLAENAGMNALEAVGELYAKPDHGIDIVNSKIVPSEELKVYDHGLTKWWAIRFATDVAITILRIDTVILARLAGGPKPRGMQPADAGDDIYS